MSMTKEQIQKTIPLPKIPFDREELQEIIDELPIASDINIKSYVDSIEKYVTEIHRYQSKRKPENFYDNMKVAILGIRNTAHEMYEHIRHYHLSLPNTIKRLILKWIAPLEGELAKRLEMSLTDRDELELKTKHLYAEQSLVSRTPKLQQLLMKHLNILKELLTESANPNPRCYISYAWASKENKEQEYWVQPFLSVLYDHLAAAGIRVVMDIRDNKPGDSIYQFMKQYHEGNYIILVGTESLLQKHYSITAHAVQTELSIILNRFEQDQKQFGQSRIYPMLISGTHKTAYPEIYDKYKTVRDAREQGYIGTLQKLIDWVYENRPKKVESQYLGLWKSLYQSYQSLPKDLKVIEQEIGLNYHRQRLDFLRQDIQYRSVEAQEKTEHSTAVTTEMIATLMKSQGSNPKTLFDANGQQFQRPYTNPDFVGRKILQEKIANHFAQSEQQILTLTAHGLSGAGKTTLAQAYYLHPPKPYTLRAWFYAESKENLYQQYIQLGLENKIKFAEDMPIEQKVRKIKEWLENQKDCLLVYDNVPGVNVVEGLLPEQGKHHILITSRNEVDWPAHQKLDVDVMEKYEAIALIRKITGIEGKEVALKELVRTLGCLPLALAQAGAYMSVKSLSTEEYLNRYEQHQQTLLIDKTTRSPKHEPVWVTFDMNFEALKTECPAALTTLKQASWLSSQAIPAVLLEAMVDNTNVKSTKLLWDNIKENVRRYSLMRVDIEQYQFSIHNLVQDILRDRQDAVEKIQTFQQACGIVNEIICWHHRFGGKYEIILSHAESLNRHGRNLSQLPEATAVNKVTTEELRASPVELGLLYKNIGLQDKALDFSKNLLAMYEKIYGKDHRHTAKAIGNLGGAYFEMGNIIESKKLFERALTIFTISPDHNPIDRANTLMNLGNVYQALGEMEDSKILFEEALAIFEVFSGKNHINTGNVLLNLGSLYIFLGKTDESEVLLERALSIFEEQYDSGHPAISKVLANLGITYCALGDARKGKEFLEKALVIRESYYGKNHLEVAKVLGNLVNANLDCGKVKECENLIKRALAIQCANYPPGHHEIAQSLMNLGVVYFKLNDLNKSKKLTEQALALKKKHYGNEHPEVASTLYNLAITNRGLKEYKIAEQNLRTAKKIYHQHFPDGHRNLDNIKNELQILSNELRLSLLGSNHQSTQKALEHSKNCKAEQNKATALTLENNAMMIIPKASEESLPTSSLIFSKALAASNSSLSTIQSSSNSIVTLTKAKP